jgi:hypothetical protein
MATLTASAAAAPAKYAINGAISRVVSYSTPAAGYSAGDVIQMVRVPNGACIVDMRLTTDLFGTSNATIGSVGDGGSATRYFGTASTSSSLALALIMNNQAIGYSYSAEDTIDIVIGTVTSASNVGVITLAITYTMDK